MAYKINKIKNKIYQCYFIVITKYFSVPQHPRSRNVAHALRFSRLTWAGPQFPPPNYYLTFVLNNYN